MDRYLITQNVLKQDFIMCLFKKGIRNTFRV